MNKKVVGAIAAALVLSASVVSAGTVVSAVEMPACLDKSKADFIYCMETYKAGDKEESLDGVVDTYISKNTYGKRGRSEFFEGVIESNPWLEGTRMNKDGQIFLAPGDEIRMCYWKSVK